jgi:hypothetical protein
LRLGRGDDVARQSAFEQSSEQLFHELPFRRYWRSLSQVPNVDVRGYQLIQLFPDDVTVAGVRVDLDVVQSDCLQNRPVWIVRG